MRNSLSRPASALAGGAAAAAVSVGGAVVRAVTSRRGGPPKVGDDDVHRPRVVTVDLPPAEVDPAALPALVALGAAVATSVAPAPGGRGTELAVRVVDVAALGGDPVQAVGRVREALRAAKAEAEVGWVTTPTRSPNPATPLNAPLRVAHEHSRSQGVL